MTAALIAACVFAYGVIGAAVAGSLDPEKWNDIERPSRLLLGAAWPVALGAGAIYYAVSLLSPFSKPLVYVRDLADNRRKALVERRENKKNLPKAKAEYK